MPYAIELFLDSATEARVRELWKRCAENVGTPMPEGSRPHVSLAVADRVSVEPLREILETFCSEMQSFPIQFPALGIFPGTEPVTFLAPKVTPLFLEMHERLWRKLGAAAEGLWDHYSPSRWVPHCTLSSRGETGDLGLLDLPISGMICEIGVVEFRPVKQVFSLPLTARKSTCHHGDR